MKLIKFSLLLTFFFVSWVAQAQDSSVEMADALRQNGKIYVVLANALIVLGVLSIFLIRVELRLKRLEKKEAMALNKD